MKKVRYKARPKRKSAQKWYKPKGTTKCGGRRWAKDKGAQYRHTVLKCIVRRDGYATAVRKMNSLANVTKDTKSKKTARADLNWLQSQCVAGKIRCSEATKAKLR